RTFASANEFRDYASADGAACLVLDAHSLKGGGLVDAPTDAWDARTASSPFLHPTLPGLRLASIDSARSGGTASTRGPSPRDGVHVFTPVGTAARVARRCCERRTASQRWWS